MIQIGSRVKLTEWTENEVHYELGKTFYNEYKEQIGIVRKIITTLFDIADLEPDNYDVFVEYSDRNVWLPISKVKENTDV